MAYPRISYPQSNYQSFQLTDAGIVFEMPEYVHIQKKTPATSGNDTGITWYDIRMDSIAATIHLTIMKENASSIQSRIMEKDRIIYEEAQQESRVSKQVFTPSDNTFTAYIYQIKGSTATPLHWMVVHPENRLIMGTILFDNPVNPEAMEAIINGVSSDIKHLIETLLFSK